MLGGGEGDGAVCEGRGEQDGSGVCWVRGVGRRALWQGLIGGRKNLCG